MTKPRDPKSPYAKYRKRPYQYSEVYQQWRSSDDEAERARHAARHAKLFLGFDPKDFPNGRYPV